MNELKRRFPVYSKLVALYPSEYRQQYGEQMLQMTADMLDGAPSRAAKLAVWAHVATDLPLNLGKQQLLYAGGLGMRNSPQFLRRNGVISTLLVLPFFGSLIANATDKILNNQTLYNSWLWRFPASGIWAVYLPMAALLLVASSYVAYLLGITKDKHTSTLKRVASVRRYIPIVIPGFLAFGILFFVFFHDSVNCLVQNPVNIVTHAHQTWQCTTNGFSNMIF